MNFSEIILYIGLSQSLFASIGVMVKRPKHVTDWLLLSFLLLIAFKFLILIMGSIHGDFLDTDFSSGIIPLTFGPFIFLYSRFLISAHKRFHATHLLHFLPVVILTATYFIFFQGKLGFNDQDFLKDDGYLPVRVAYAAFYFAFTLTYTILTFIVLRNYNKSLSDRFSFSTGENKLYWLYFLASWFTLSFFSYFIIGGMNAVNFREVYNSQIVFNGGLTLLTFIISYFGLRQPHLFKRVLELKEERAKLPVEKTSTEKPKETTEKQGEIENAKELIEHLNQFMESERPFLNPELNVQDLATHLNIPRPQLTVLLNNYIGKNFFTYVNEYRIEAVKSKLTNPDLEHLTLLAIAYDSGFNSKSAFNTIFKQYVGVTPSEYKKALVHKDEAD